MKPDNCDTSRRTVRGRRSEDGICHRRLPKCHSIGRDRYLDGHLARGGRKPLRAGSHTFEVKTLACPDCPMLLREPPWRRTRASGSRCEGVRASFAADHESGGAAAAAIFERGQVHRGGVRVIPRVMR